MTTNTKTFGKEAKSLVNTIFPTVAKHKKYGSNMKQTINFYDAKGKHLGYWTNDSRELGVFRKF